MTRLRTFNRAGWTLWLDRVPAMHGYATRCTLWKARNGGGQDRVLGGVELAIVRRYFERPAE
jgi:hypothetical protein